ncbi:MAG: hypothetical protein AAF687_08835 [Pseudomonadota bacterium]
MTMCTCMVQEGQISAEQEAALRSETSAFAQRHFGSPGEINWITVPKGNGYTAGELSTSVIVSVRSDRSLAPSDRIPLLHELEEIWRTHADRTPNEVVSVITDPVA